MRQGLAAWMHAWPRQVTDDPPQPVLFAAAPSALPESLAGQLVTVLASMVFAARQEVYA